MRKKAIFFNVTARYLLFPALFHIGLSRRTFSSLYMRSRKLKSMVPVATHHQTADACTQTADYTNKTWGVFTVLPLAGLLRLMENKLADDHLLQVARILEEGDCG